MFKITATSGTRQQLIPHRSTSIVEGASPCLHPSQPVHPARRSFAQASEAEESSPAEEVAQWRSGSADGRASQAPSSAARVART
jgi:hypothetical protein